MSSWCGFSNESGPERVYRFVPGSSTTATINLTQLSADLDLFLLQGPSSCTAYGGCARSTAGGTSSEQIVSSVTGGSEYWVVVDGYGGATSPYNIEIQCSGGATTTAASSSSSSTTARTSTTSSTTSIGGSGCATTATTLCLAGRFEVSVYYSTIQGGGFSGWAHPIPLSSLGVSRGGLFWFFGADNPELLIKVLDGCGVNDQFWIYSSAGTNVGFTINVRDSVTGRSTHYTNQDLVAAAPIQDVQGLECLVGSLPATEATLFEGSKVGVSRGGNSWLGEEGGEVSEEAVVDVNFGDVTVGSSSTQCWGVYYVSGSGGSCSGSGSFSGVSDPATAPFGMTNYRLTSCGNCSGGSSAAFPVSVGVGQWLAMDLSFSPTAAGTFSDNATISAPGGNVTWAMRGRGVGGASTSSTTSVPPGGCQNTSTALCIGGRFRVEVDFSTVQGGGYSGRGQAIPLTSLGVSRGGLFWFFGRENPEMLVKVLDGCGVNGKFWIYGSAGTNVGLTITVTDTATGRVWRRTNPDLTPLPPIQDVNALSCN